MDTDPQTIGRHPQPVAELFPSVYLGAPLFLIVVQYDFLIFRTQPTHTHIEAFVTLFVRLIRDRNRFWIGFLPQIFEVDFLGYTVEVKRGIADIGFADFVYPQAGPVYGFIGEVLRNPASSAFEDLYQPATYLFVPRAGAFAIWVKPIEESVEIIWSKVLVSHLNPPLLLYSYRVSIAQNSNVAWRGMPDRLLVHEKRSLKLHSVQRPIYHGACDTQRPECL